MQLRFEESEQTRFGCRMARLTLDSACESADAERIMEMCRSAQVEMLILRLPTDKIALAQALETLKFRIMDCLVYYQCPTESVTAAKPSTVKIREATGEDAAAVGEIARLCFSEYFSHYHADTRLDPVKVSDGYIDWAKRSCLDEKVASTVCLPIVHGTIAGFFALRRNSPSEGEVVLCAVHPRFTGTGILGELVIRSKQWCRDNGMQRMIISTLINNLKVQRACTNRGFCLYKSYYTFHRWFI
jgi:N-acetylglutamate synthase-like GNAT family acetyltransferase